MRNPHSSKVMTTREAISRFVHDGDVVITCNYTESMPYSLIFEIIRQKKRKLTYFSQSGTADAEFLVAGDCVEKMCSAFPVPRDEEILFIRKLSPNSSFSHAVGNTLALEYFMKQAAEKKQARN